MNWSLFFIPFLFNNAEPIKFSIVHKFASGDLVNTASLINFDSMFVEEIMK